MLQGLVQKAPPETASAPVFGQAHARAEGKPSLRTAHFPCVPGKEVGGWEALQRARDPCQLSQDSWVSSEGDGAGPILRSSTLGLGSLFWHLLCPRAPWRPCGAQGDSKGYTARYASLGGGGPGLLERGCSVGVSGQRRPERKGLVSSAE